MGFDVGERRIGVSVSDLLGYTAQGITVLDRKNKDWESLLDSIITEYDISGFVVGLPRNMDGTLGESAYRCKGFGEQLEKKYSLPVYFWDERLSSAAVERALIESDMSRKKRKGVIDQLAAVWILQGFLDRNRRN